VVAMTRVNQLVRAATARRSIVSVSFMTVAIENLPAEVKTSAKISARAEDGEQSPQGNHRSQRSE
jgi:hypothetical protein